MKFKKDTSPFFDATDSVGHVMRQVLYALIPGTLAMSWFFGIGILLNVILSILLALGFEWLALKLRKRPIKPFLSDYSAVVTGWLLALSIPPLAPWWLVAVGVFFAIIIAKHLYGGLGYNPFNPAMIGYAVLIISFPTEMSQWLSPGNVNPDALSIMQQIQLALGISDPANNWDAITSATPLDAVKNGLHAEKSIENIYRKNHIDLITQTAWLISSIGFLAGGLWLLYKKIIQWQIPVALLLSLFVISGIFYLIDNSQFTSPLFHLFSGATMLAAFFIATDPVSASTTPRGKLLYATGIGLLIYIIRSWGNYPDSVAFAVLIMNMAVPLIDYYTQPRVYGH